MRAAISLVAAICVASGGAAAYAPGGRAAPFSPPQRSALAGDGSVPASPAPTVHEPGPARLRPGASLAVAAALLGASLLGPAAPAALAAPPPALASSPVAAQIDIDSVPPKNIVIDIADLPVIGPLLSGTYARIDTGAASAVGQALGGGWDRRRPSPSDLPGTRSGPFRTSPARDTWSLVRCAALGLVNGRDRTWRARWRGGCVDVVGTIFSRGWVIVSSRVPLVSH